MTERIEQWLQCLEQKLDEAKTCNDKQVAEEKAQDVVKKSSQLSNMLVALLPEQVRQYWITELERLETNKTENEVYCSYCANTISNNRQIRCPLGCRERFCSKNCLKKCLTEHRKRCLLEKKRKLRRALEQNGMDW